MEKLTWTGSLGSILNPAFQLVALAFVVLLVAQMAAGWVFASPASKTNSDGTLTAARGPNALLGMGVQYSFLALIAICLIYLLAGMVLSPQTTGIVGGVAAQFSPVWLALVVTFLLSMVYKRRLGLYGKLYDSMIGMIGFGLVMFWVYTALFVGVFDMIATHDPLSQLSGMKNKLPGTPMRGADPETCGSSCWYLLGGDNLARDVFSRMVNGSVIVIVIAPFATLFAFMVGITLGLPAGYFRGPALLAGTPTFWAVGLVLVVATLFAFLLGGVSVGFSVLILCLMVLGAAIFLELDTSLSFLANLILAFPVILLFYLLVTPEIVATGIPNYMAMVLFIFPIIFVGVLLNSRFYTRPKLRNPLLAGIMIAMFWLYLSGISEPGTVLHILPPTLDLFNVQGGILVVFVSVVFVNSPTVFRIVRGLTLDIQTRDYVAAAQTRGEGPWYIMLWEILPNARGPLIVDFCLRIGYTTILLGTLGFFGLGLPPESPDWGTTINDGRKLLSIYPHPALVPAFSLLSLVLGLNLLADGLREESLRD